MTQVVLPITSRANTDPNLFSDVVGNDNAIKTVVNGDLRNDNIAAAGTAEIAIAKLATSSDAKIIVCNASGVPTYRTASGDVTNNNTGVFTIANNAVTSAKIADGTIATGDIADGAVTNVKLGLTAANDNLGADIINLAGSLTQIAQVGATSGASYLILGQVHVHQTTVSVGSPANVHVSLTYNGAEHESPDIIVVGDQVVSLNLAVAITSGTNITLKARSPGAAQIDVRGTTGGFAFSRLCAIRYA